MLYFGVPCSLLLALLIQTGKASKQDDEKKILDTILTRDKYDSRIRPAGVNGSDPVVVHVNMYIRSLSEIDDVKMDFNTQLTFRQQWVDERLKFADPNKMGYISLTRSDKIWRPDIFFSNEKNGHFHNIIMPNELVRIHPDGTILYSIRISLNLACKMNLKYYPFDKQSCAIVMASYAYTTNDIVFIWKAGDPVQITKSLSLPQFNLNGFHTEYCTSKTNTGEYSCLKVRLDLSRDVKYHIQQSYLSTTCFVVMSWIAFWLDPKSTMARVGLWIGVLIALVIKASSLNENNPASYTKAIDVWVGICFSFIFCALIELCIVNNAITTEEQRRQMNKLTAEDADKHILCIDDPGYQPQTRNYTFILLRWLNRYPSRAQRIDAISRILFPAAFAFFNLVYWPTYASQRDPA